MNLFKKKKKPMQAPSENEKLRAEAHEKLDDAHERLDRVLVKLRHAIVTYTSNKMAPR